MIRLRTLLPVLTGSAALLCSTAQAQTTYTWTNFSDNWSVDSLWVGGNAPSGTNPTDILRFGGDAALGTWQATNDIATPLAPFILNRLVLETVNTGGGSSANILDGGGLKFAGIDPQILQNGSVGFSLELGIQLTGNLTIGGTGAGAIAFRGPMTGLGDIVKSGPASLSFGNPPLTPTSPSQNTWMGSLTLQGGDVLLESNRAAAGALRANPINFATNSVLRFTRTGDPALGASLRLGNLSGNTGSVQATVVGAALENYNVIITALSNTSFGGSVIGPTPAQASLDPGLFVVRGPGSQTFTGTISTYKDVVVGAGSTMRLAGAASLSNQFQGAITMTGGTFVLDNTNGNAPAGRLRDASSTSTGIETIGGGTFRLIGADNGTVETLGRLQLGAFASGSGETKRRSGHLNVEVVHRSTTGPTELIFQSYSRDEQNLKQYATVDFSAKDANGNALVLGNAGASARIRLSGALGFFVPPTQNGLLTITAGPIKSVGWATVNGTDFAGYSIDTVPNPDVDYGVIPVASTLWVNGTPPAATANARIEQSVTSPAAGYTVNSIKMAPTSPGQSLSISGAGHLNSTAFLLAGAIDFAISNTSTGGISGNGPRFFHVQEATLTVGASLNGAVQSVVKSGAGTMVLTNNANVNLFGSQTHVSINGGILRATPGTTLPNAELRLRGGQLEIPGGGIRSMTLGTGSGTINWTNISSSAAVVEEDMGSGGISAFGADLTFNLNLPPTGPQTLNWEDPGFIGSSYELIFGSRQSNARLTWTRGFSLTETGSNSPYAARTIRVLDNPDSAADWTRISGSISGTRQNDLVKTGPGMLELTAINSYAGATVIQDGTLLVNSPGDSKASFVHDVLTGGTLGGNGTVGAVRVNGGGKLAPGSLASRTETLNVIGDLSFVDSSSQFVLEIGGSTVGNSLTGYDRLNVTGAVSLGNADLVGSFVNGFTGFTGTSDVLFLILNDGFDAVQGQFSDGSVLSIGSQFFAISYNADSATSAFTSPTGNDVAIQLIPEPSSAILIGLGALLVSRRRRTAK